VCLQGGGGVALLPSAAAAALALAGILLPPFCRLGTRSHRRRPSSAGHALGPIGHELEQHIQGGAGRDRDLQGKRSAGVPDLNCALPPVQKASHDVRRRVRSRDRLVQGRRPGSAASVKRLRRKLGEDLDQRTRGWSWPPGAAGLLRRGSSPAGTPAASGGSLAWHPLWRTSLRQDCKRRSGSGGYRRSSRSRTISGRHSAR
jgi:hypothetical protein